MTKLLTAFLLALAAVPLLAQTAEQCPAGKVPILILGAYHMDSPGLDAVNMHVDDVLTPKRQREIEDLIDRLATFAPTKVAIEAPRWSRATNDRYKQFLAGTAKLTPNEIDQVAFRLARKRNLAAITPVDFPMWMDGLMPIEQHTPKKKPARASTSEPVEDDSPVMREVRAEVAKSEKLLASSSIIDYLAYLNTPEQAALHHRWDVIYNLEPGDGPNLYANTDMATNWYKRNLRIFTNLLEATEPGDRVFVLIGAGHTKLLRDFASEHPAYCLVDAVAYLKR
ncbi:MAG TPA: DUF5694 domain-containing protein [Thermoanaerobaculia bacterium]|nr:DUF5694 domain-containing protein [Thermoanaerobaculia bacterium]